MGVRTSHPWWVALGIVYALMVASDARAGWDPLQKAHRAARAGAEALAAGDTLRAIESYLQAQALSPEDPHIRMAVGEAFYRSGEFRSSLNQFKAVANPEDPALSGQSLYNAGNAAFEMGEYRQALDLYTRALLEGGAEPDLLYNLELTQSILEQGQPDPDREESSPSDEQSQEEQQDQQSPPQEQPEGDQEQPNEEQQPQEQQQEQEEQQQPEEDQDEESQPEEPDQPQPAPPDSARTEPPPPEPAAADSMLALPEGMTPEEALRLLEALDHDEEELRRSIQRRLRGAETASENDW